MTFDEDFLPLVLPYVSGCPPQTALVHLLQAAKVFCRRTLAWNVQHDAIATVAGDATYSLTLPSGTGLVKVLWCEIADSFEYGVVNGSLGRKFVREPAGRNVCLVTSPASIQLQPAPVLSGQDLIVDIALMPTATDTAWPDDLAEHAEFIAAGAVGSLAAMPRVDWRDAATAVDQRDRFERRIHAVYHKTAKTLIRPDRARRSVQF